MRKSGFRIDKTIYFLKIRFKRIFLSVLSLIQSNLMSGNTDTIERNNGKDQKLNLEDLIAEFGKEEFDDENDYEERK
ncbi:MAG: hypothetical protein WB053_13365 [Nitrososphaeraceae archaeon]|jgi:hypothetical protein